MPSVPGSPDSDPYTVATFSPITRPMRGKAEKPAMLDCNGAGRTNAVPQAPHRTQGTATRK